MDEQEQKNNAEIIAAWEVYKTAKTRLDELLDPCTFSELEPLPQEIREYAVAPIKEIFQEIKPKIGAVIEHIHQTTKHVVGLIGRKLEEITRSKDFLDYCQTQGKLIRNECSLPLDKERYFMIVQYILAKRPKPPTWRNFRISTRNCHGKDCWYLAKLVGGKEYWIYISREFPTEERIIERLNIWSKKYPERAKVLGLEEFLQEGGHNE